MCEQDYEALKAEWQKEWNEKGEKYAKAVNDMVAFAEVHGWDAYKGEDAVDEREGVTQLCEAVFELLKDANERGETEKFRADFPPSNVIFDKNLRKKLRDIDQICPLGGENVLFIASNDDGKTLYLLEGDRVSEVADDVIAVGKSKRNEIYALLRRKEIELIKGYDGRGGGELVARFSHELEIIYDEAEILPFNDGKKVLLTAHDGIFLISQSGAKLIHPIYEDEDEYELEIAMANATLSNDNELIVAGEQDSDHVLMDSEGERLGCIGAQSSYPHFCLFSADDTQLITNSCHFYNGVTIGVDRALLKRGLEVGFYDPDGGDEQNFTLIDDAMRVYAGVATEDFYILGDAYGYIKAVGKDGRKIWRHYLGGTIKSMALSEDGGVLFVGTYGGRLHKLRLGAGQDSHTIGNGNHKEEFRLIAYEDKIYRW
ncbi:PQQ-binding-like beta-propeller repeat protein [uncultured Campylobacter sp.]|uniref:PQQ-binding-like beta-propeller repeat protein n=1 Tax=uncultured Campylobacter sp. TaxID=218934 RepID=UPI002626013B|nr:PQQ-binding-like beta-propeller repeat protein [uncultured Campylobacter sp.]